jgi:1,4-alpha-glucan branching enzyme
MLRSGNSPEYARKRVKDHLLRFIAIHDQITRGRIDQKWLAPVEQRDNLFPDINVNYWA